MKEIGEKLKEARESMGITVEEASEDLKITVEQINNIEAGNMEAFKDIFYLKYFIRDYSKYLGLNKEDMVDEFNEYLFDYTSKISLDDIKNAKKKEKKEEDRIRSPYTIIHKNPKKISLTLLIGIIVLVVAISSIVIYIVVSNNNKKDDNIIAATSIERRYL